MRPSPDRRTRSLIALLASWYVVVLLLSGGLLGLQQLLGIDPTLISIVQFAPLIAVLIFTMLNGRRLAPLTTAAIDWRTFVRRWGLASAVTLGYLAMIVAAAFLVGAKREDVPFRSTAMLMLFVVLQFAGSFGEEVGWRGFLQPALETQLPRLAACVVTGLLWAVWHVQKFADPLTAITFTISCVALSIVFGYLVAGSIWQRGLIAATMHGAINIALFLTVDPARASTDAWPLPLAFLALLGACYAARRTARRARQVPSDATISA